MPRGAYARSEYHKEQSRQQAIQTNTERLGHKPVYSYGHGKEYTVIATLTPEEADAAERDYLVYRNQMLAPWFEKQGIKFDGDVDAAFTELKRRRPEAFSDAGDTGAGLFI